MNKFTELNQETQKTDQDAVTSFVGDLMQHAKADLQDAQDKLTAFKEGNAGKLPEQVQLNIARENGFTEKIRSARDQIFRDEQALEDFSAAKRTEKARLEFYDEQQAALETLRANPGSPAAQQDQELVSLNKYIDGAEFAIQQDARNHDKDKYLPLKNAIKQLEGIKEKRDQLQKRVQAREEAAAEKAAADALKPKETNTAAAIQEKRVRFDVQQNLDSIDLKEARVNSDIDRAKADLITYQKESDDVNQMLKDSTGIEGQYEELNHAKEMAWKTPTTISKRRISWRTLTDS